MRYGFFAKVSGQENNIPWWMVFKLVNGLPFTLIFLVGEMLEKFLWRSSYIFGLSLMPEIQSSKNFSILTSCFEGQVQTACSHHGPYAKWSVYLNFTSAVASRLVISCTGYCVE